MARCCRRRHTKKATPASTATPTTATGTATATTGKELPLSGEGGGADPQLEVFVLVTGFRQYGSLALHSLKVAPTGSCAQKVGLSGTTTISLKLASSSQLAGTLPLMLLLSRMLQAGRQQEG